MLRLIGASLLAMVLTIPLVMGSTHAGSFASDSTHDQSHVVYVAPVPVPCQEHLSDITGLSTFVDGDDLVVRLEVVNLVEPRLSCNGMQMDPPVRPRTDVFYQAHVRVSGGYDTVHPDIKINARGSGNGQWMFACGGLTLEGPNGPVVFSKCMPLTKTGTALELRVPLVGSFEHYYGGSSYNYTIEGKYSPSASTRSSWDGGTHQNDSGPKQNIMVFQLHDSIVAPSFVIPSS